MGRSVEQLLSRVEDLVRANEAWRAKELLRGAIASGRIDGAILERYGRLLDSLGDRVEAGKYLFLAGASGPDVDDAVQLFLARHSRADHRAVLSQLPTAIRNRNWSDLPPQVATALAGIGVDSSQHRKLTRKRTALPRTLGDNVTIAVAFLLIGAFAVGTINGVRAIVSWLREVF